MSLQYRTYSTKDFNKAVPYLTQWELKFYKSVIYQNSHSNKQIKVLDKIHQKVYDVIGLK